MFYLDQASKISSSVAIFISACVVIEFLSFSSLCFLVAIILDSLLKAVLCFALPIIVLLSYYINRDFFLFPRQKQSCDGSTENRGGCVPQAFMLPSSNLWT